MPVRTFTIYCSAAAAENERKILSSGRAAILCSARETKAARVRFRIQRACVSACVFVMEPRFNSFACSVCGGTKSAGRALNEALMHLVSSLRKKASDKGTRACKPERKYTISHSHCFVCRQRTKIC